LIFAKGYIITHNGEGHMYYRKLHDNPLENYADLAQAFRDTLGPYEPFSSPGCARIDLGPPGATFSRNACYLEGFARLLWGLVPYLAGGTTYEGLDRILTGLSNGVNPEHKEFWGWPGDYDQLLVEMAVFGYALCLIPEIIWDPLSGEAKANFSRWLSTINKKKIPKCNWIFFRILVNCGLKNVGAEEADDSLLDASLALVEEFYLDNGWYNDGFPGERRARDYYIPWGMHYYGLIFARCCEKINPHYAQEYRKRASLFAKDFLHWFSADGPALPYGRSLTYRFAQSAFWGALAFAGEEALPWPRIKGVFLRNLRWWFHQPAYSETGLLSIGYTYPNLHMAERYNSPNSPLWALKAFIPLACAHDHPFWQAAEEPLEKGNATYVQEATGFILSDSEETGHLYALNAGQWTPGGSNEHNYMAEKYSKFAYSTYFGFNVTTDTYGIDKLAPDNMLLISKGGRFYHYRTESHDHEVTETYLFSRWEPFKGIKVETYLIPSGPWSLRIHHIVSDRGFLSIEGGFALPYTDALYPIDESIHKENENESWKKTVPGFSGIKNLGCMRMGKIVIANPNANIMHTHTLIPTLRGNHEKGEAWLGCAVLAHPDPGKGETLWKKVDMNALVKQLPQTIQKIFS
jgi:hypothetical protein